MTRERQHLLLSPGDLGEFGGAARLEIAALVEVGTGVAGVGWRLSTVDGTETLRTETHRRRTRRLLAELSTLQDGLGEAARRGCRRLVIRVPDPAILALLGPAPPARWPRLLPIAQSIRATLSGFDGHRVEVASPRDPELWHAVGEALDVGLHAAAEREELRVRALERIWERARSVRLEEHGGAWTANGRYRVELEPMRCECPAWTRRWSRAPIAGRRAQRLPCKHLVALALRQGRAVPRDLLEGARRAPA